MDAHTLFLKQTGHIESLNVNKKIMKYPFKVPETSLQIYKNNYFNNYTHKKGTAIATNMEKRHAAVLKVSGIWNSKSNNFVSLTVQNYCLLMACFKTIISRNPFCRKKVYVFEVTVFAAFLTDQLPFSVSDYDGKT